MNGSLVLRSDSLSARLRIIENTSSGHSYNKSNVSVCGAAINSFKFPSLLSILVWMFFCLTLFLDQARGVWPVQISEKTGGCDMFEKSREGMENEENSGGWRFIWVGAKIFEKWQDERWLRIGGLLYELWQSVNRTLAIWPSWNR